MYYAIQGKKIKLGGSSKSMILPFNMPPEAKGGLLGFLASAGGGGAVLAGGSGVVIVSEDAFPKAASAPGIWTMQDVYHYEVREEWI